MKPLFRAPSSPGPLTWGVVILCTAFALLWPALWNGYPLFFYDSGDYIDSSFTHTPAVWRTLPYGLFLALTHFKHSLWLSISAQGLICAWLLWELVLAFGVGRPVRVMAATVVLLAIGTGLPWFAAQIMPDLFTGVMVLGIILLAFARAGALRLTLMALVTIVAISAHASHAGTAVALAALLVVLAIAWRQERPRLWLPLLAVLLGVLATPVAHRLFTGEFYMSRSGSIMALARLMRSGEAQAYLREACPAAGYSLCPYVEELKSGPNAANDLLWDQRSPFYKIEGWKRWREFSPEAQAIVAGTLTSRPLPNLVDALRSLGEQLVTFGTGSGLVPRLYEATEVHKRLFPQESAQYLAAREYAGFDLSGISALHVAVLSLFMVTALALAIEGRRRRDRVAQMLLLVIFATLVNAAITGIVSNPDDRYQARLVWLFVPAVLVAFAAPRLPVRRPWGEKR